MAKLIAKPLGEGLLPLTIGTLTLSEASPKRLTAIAPWPGSVAAVAEILRGVGLDWPTADRAVKAEKGGACLWSGRDQAFLIDHSIPEGLADHAAVTELGDAWACVKLTGAEASAVLTRLVPLDLSPRAFAEGASARTGLGHMAILLHRSSARSFTIYLFRSMIASAVHEIEGAMRSVAARAQL
ncbi:MAG: sarcosine oxidase subunit gamma [Rhodobacteraceae bacterium]|nr:sarcosine oxidase subunit gamma [Paracoccaceae bacterium]